MKSGVKINETLNERLKGEPFQVISAFQHFGQLYNSISLIKLIIVQTILSIKCKLVVSGGCN